MECREIAITAAMVAASSPTSLSPISSPSGSFSSSSPPATILSPCAACKDLRRRCVDKCVLAPYFPPTEPLKFTFAHKVIGASNIIKLLQFMSIIILTYSLPIVVSRTGNYSFSLIMLLLLRIVGIILPLYIILKAATSIIRRRQQGLSHSLENSSNQPMPM